MQFAHRVFSAAALALLSASSFATTTTYTSSASFLSNVAAGAYTESFTGVAETPPATFTGGAFSYAISAPQGMFGFDDFISTNQINEAITISFTGASVFAIGGNFFATDINPDFQSVSMTVTLSDGTVETFKPATLSDSYRGFVSTVAITSLTLGGPGQSLYASLDNLTVGAAVPAIPEPTTWALLGLGLAGIAVVARRKA